MSIDLEILKKIILEADEEKETEEAGAEDSRAPLTPFEKDPMRFILNKYASLNEILTQLMTPSFIEYLNGIFIVAPKPTTFKIDLHNGQYFFLTYLGKAYQATIAGKNYYLMTVGEKQLCMQAISRLLRYGTPLKTKGPEGAEQGTELAGDEGGGGALGGEETASAGGGEESGGGGGKSDGGEFGYLGAKYGKLGAAAGKKGGLSESVEVLKELLASPEIKKKESPGKTHETDVIAALKSSAGLSIDEIEDEAIKDLFNQLELDPSSISSNDIYSTGDANSKRPVDVEKGAQDVGEKIADTVINAGDRKIYLSLKDTRGKYFYNGPVVPFIIEKNGKVFYDPKKKESNALAKKIFDLFGISVKRLVDSLNDYVPKNISEIEMKLVNKVSTKKSKDIINLLASGLGFGYYYVRRKANGFFVYKINSVEDAEALIGTIKGVSVKYPGKNSKALTISITTKSDITNKESKYLIDIRDKKGGKLAPMKIMMAMER